MSISSTPRGASFDNVPVISPIEYFNAEKLESSIPCLVIKKLSDIVKEYFQLKPQLLKKENEIKGLYTYNQKMIETIESFMEHEKKIVKKYNRLCSIYVKTFKEYLSNKNMDVNFRDLASPLTSISETFNMNDWKVEIEENPVLSVKRSYQEMLFNAIKKHYLNEDNVLEVLLEKQIAKLPVSPQYQAIDLIKTEIRELNTTTPTLSNMFDLLNKRKNIELLIKQLDQNYTHQYTSNDLGFIEEVNQIHSTITNPSPDKLKAYLEHQAQIRRNLKKKSKKFREGLEMEFERVEAEIAELREQNSATQKRIMEVETERNDYRNKLQYLQIKAGVNNSKKDKNASNTSLIEDPVSVGVKENNKKLQLRISELETEIGQLKQEIAEKEEAHKHLNVKRQLMNSNSQMEELRLKLCSKLMEKGIMDTEAMTSGEMFDRLMEKLNNISVRHYELRNSTQQQKQFVDIKITDSVPIIEIKQPNIQTPKRVSESIIERDPSVIIEAPSPAKSASEENNILESDDKEHNRETQANEMRLTETESQPPIYAIEPVKKQVKRSLQQQQQPQKLMKKKNYAAPLSSSALLSISERKSIDEESKMQDASKILKEKSLIDERFHIKEQNKQLEELSNNIKQLEEKLAIEKREHERDVERYEAILTEKKLKQPSVFESMEKELKNMDADHAGQIENICQSIVRELQKLQGDEFIKMVSNVQQAIKNFKSSSSNNPALHINEIPVLFNEDHLFKSENIIAHLFGGKPNQPANRRKYSILIDDKSKSGRLSLNSGEVKFQIRYEKSIYFGNKDNQPSEEGIYAPRIIESKAQRNNNNYIVKDESSIKIDQDELIDIVKDFQGTSRKKNNHNNSENSLKFSQSNLKNSRDDDIRSSIRLIDKIDRKILNDAEFISKLENKIEEIKNCNDTGSDLYWFYKKYRQAMQALESTEAKVREFERKKETCMNQLMEEDANLSKHKLEEKIYFLQQRVKELEDRLLVSKQEYEYNMTEHIKEIDNFRETAIDKLIQGIFSENYGKN